MKKILLLSTICCLWGLQASGQEDPARVSDLRVERAGSSVEISCLMDVEPKAASRNQKLTLTPLLFRDGHSLELDPVVVGTRRTEIVDFRNRTALPAGATEARRGRTVSYAASVPYEGWMDGASLRLGCTSEGCGRETPLGVQPLGGPFDLKIAPIASIEEHIVPEPRIEQAARRWKFSKEDMIVGYRVNKTDVDLSLFDNERVLDEITRVVDELREDPSTPLKKIEITGYASPEGRTEHNVYLAGRRAEALREYLQQRNGGLPDEMFSLTNGGEDWAGLRERVAASEMSRRAEVLEILDAGSPDMKRQLQLLDDGRPYRYMLKEYFPHLRNACYISVWYDTLTDTAADTINQALEMIREERYGEALDSLLPLEKDPRAWNPIGVCYMMTGRTPEAKTWLQKAAAAGSESARENLTQIAQNE